MRQSILLGLAGALLALAAEFPKPPPSLTELLQSQESLSNFTSLIKNHPDLLLKLPNSAGITILAPTDSAFANIPGTSLDGTWNPDDPSVVVPVLSYHLLPAILSAGALASGPTVMRPTLLTNSSWTNVTSPPDQVPHGGQNVLVTKQPDGGVVLISSEGTRASMVTGDLVFDGGIVHTIDNFLIPPARLEDTAETFQLLPFLGMLYAGGQMPAAAEMPGVTIFAPRTAALRIIQQALQGLDAADVARVAGYHVVPGKVLSAAMLANGSLLETAATLRDAPDPAAGRLSLGVRRSGNNLYINSAQVVQPDVLLANGIMHIVANVLNPDAPAVQPVPELASQPPVFSTQSGTATGLPFTTALPCTADCPVTATTPTRTREVTATDDVQGKESDGAAPRCTGAVTNAALVGMAGLGVGLAFIR